MIEVYICQLPQEKNRTVLDQLLPSVSAEKQERVKKIVHINDAFRTVVGELLVRYILQKKYGSIPKQLVFDKNLYGKPSLSQYPLFHYNIAHSGECVVCAVHDKEIGMDVEKIESFDLKVAEQFFTIDEYEDCLKTKEEINTGFYDLWTLKESYVKAQGRGLSIPLDSFNVKVHSCDYIELSDTNTGEIMTDYIFKQYRIQNQYKLAVCAKDDNVNKFEELPIMVSLSNICDDLRISLSG